MHIEESPDDTIYSSILRTLHFLKSLNKKIRHGLQSRALTLCPSSPSKWLHIYAGCTWIGNKGFFKATHQSFLGTACQGNLPEVDPHLPVPRPLLAWGAASPSSSMEFSPRQRSAVHTLSRVRPSETPSLPGSSVHGIFQARVLEWGANIRI